MSTGRNVVNFSEGPSRRRITGVEGRVHHPPGLDWISPLAEVNEMITTAREALFVGRLDQDRFGDLLMPHVLGRLLHLSRVRCGGLVNVDFSAIGGHSVRNYGECALEMRSPGLKLVHVGGDVLDLDLVDGYREAAEGEEAERFESLAGISGREELYRYVRRRSGQLSDFAYLLEPTGEFWGAGLSFHAVGLPDPGRLSPERRERLLGNLRRAQFVGVRDEAGANFLAREGIAVERMPCALSVLPQVCARQLRECRDRDSLESIRHRFPDGWITVETSGVRAADAERLVTALREVSEREHLGLVFFEANRTRGGAPRSLRSWVEAFPEWQAAEFGSRNLWEIASLLLHSRLYCGTCLAARTLCMSGGVARIQIPAGDAATLGYCELWEHDEVPIEFAADENWSDALGEALSVDWTILQHHATWLHERYRQSFDRFCRDTGIEPRLVPGVAVETEHDRAANGRAANDRASNGRVAPGFREGWGKRPTSPRGGAWRTGAATA
jgi:hypothetical protein